MGIDGFMAGYRSAWEERDEQKFAALQVASEALFRVWAKST